MMTESTATDVEMVPERQVRPSVDRLTGVAVRWAAVAGCTAFWSGLIYVAVF